MLLPAQMRSRFNNDPAELLKFIKDPANLDEAVKLGILVKKEAPKGDPVPPPAPPSPVPPVVPLLLLQLKQF